MPFALFQKLEEGTLPSVSWNKGNPNRLCIYFETAFQGPPKHLAQTAIPWIETMLYWISASWWPLEFQLLMLAHQSLPNIILTKDYINIRRSNKNIFTASKLGIQNQFLKCHLWPNLHYFLFKKKKERKIPCPSCAMPENQNVRKKVI